ncbi:putative phage tail protein [Shewanella xiamenensis]|uniref:putative phage tail protein n=1 Tax=Shewanella xiamenensis TaxID=332186 RepID=UPI000849E1F0|nr:putative phage tail protein [Shewanella xiamenensis]
MSYSAADYCDVMQKLMPRGFAWNTGPDGNLHYVLGGIAAQLARVDSRAAQLEREFYPETSLELLEEWEDYLGLPECGLASDDLEKRRLDAYAKETADGGLAPWYYEALAARAGFEIEVDVAYGHHCESDCEAALYHPLSGLAPVVYSTANATHWTLCTESCLQPVRRFGDGRLECLLNTYKPAHLRFVYGYLDAI